MRIVVVGAGSVGMYLIQRLALENHDITVIDLNETILEKVASELDVQIINGSGSSLTALRKAGVGKIDIFIAVTDSDETNLIACLLADNLNKFVKKIARVRELTPDEGNLPSAIAAIFDHFSNPDFEAVQVFTRLVDIPGAVEVMEFGDRRLLVIGMVLRSDSPLNGCRLRELPERVDASDLLVAAIARDGQLIVPRGEDRLVKGDELYVVVPADRVAAIYQLVGEDPRKIQSIILYGCSLFSKRLANKLVEKGLRVRLIESNERLCVEAAEELHGVLVLHGDGTDQELLESEGVADCDLFIGAGLDQEENILAALLAKKLGAQRAAVITTKASYLKLVPELGIDIVVNPHIAAASSILRFVRAGSISTIVSTRDDSAEVLEIEVNPNSKIVGRPLRELTLPTGVIVVAKIRDQDVSIPKGDTTFAPGDKAIFFASKAALPKLQKLLR